MSFVELKWLDLFVLYPPPRISPDANLKLQITKNFLKKKTVQEIW